MYAIRSYYGAIAVLWSAPNDPHFPERARGAPVLILDIVTDGNMWYDDYVGVIGSFCWYLYERIPGFEHTRNPHPSVIGAGPSVGKTFLDDWGGVINNGPVDKTGHAIGRNNFV